MAVTLNGQQVFLRQETIDSFRETLRGEVLTSGDPGYDEARTVWNGMIDRKPSLLALCAVPPRHTGNLSERTSGPSMQRILDIRSEPSTFRHLIGTLSCLSALPGCVSLTVLGHSDSPSTTAR